MRLKVVALDFDGVIVESNDIKDRAFSEIFHEYPEYYEKMMAYHYAHNAVDRYQKFRYFVEEILKVYDKSVLIEELSNKFSKITKQAIIQSRYVEGALSFLNYVRNKYPLYLISATPQGELNEIIQARDLEKYFKEVFGAPLSKTDIIKKVMVIEKASPDETLFVGDSPEDLRAASLLGIQFVGRKSSRQLSDSNYVIVDDLYGLREYLQKTYERMESGSKA